MEMTRLSVLISAVGAMLGTFLPWAHSGPLSMSGNQGVEGWIIFVLFIPPLLFAALGERRSSMSKGAGMSTLICAGLGTAMAIMKIVTFKSGVSTGFGLLLIVAAGVATILLTVASIRKAD